MAAHQAPPSLGFSRQEHWSGLPFPSPMHESEKWKWSRSVMSDPQWPHGLQPTRLLRPWDFPGKSTGVGCHCNCLKPRQIMKNIPRGLFWVTRGLQECTVPLDMAFIPVSSKGTTKALWILVPGLVPSQPIPSWLTLMKSFIKRS